MEREEQKQRLILVVDDDMDFRYQRRVELESAGFKVKEACTAKQALLLCEEEEPDLVVADLMMEQDDAGFILCYQLKKRNKGLPIIMVTGAASETGMEFDASTSEERAWIKADALLNKPVRTEQILGEIKRLLGE